MRRRVFLGAASAHIVSWMVARAGEPVAEPPKPEGPMPEAGKAPPAGAAAPAEEKPTNSQPQPAPAVEVRPQQWEFGISIFAAGGPCANLLGTFPVPTEWPEQQVRLVREEISPHVRRQPDRTMEGLRQVVFSVPQLGAGQTATCYLTFEILRKPQFPPADAQALSLAKEPPREVRKYWTASPLIESTQPRFRMLAQELMAEKESAWEKVEALALGVRERVKWEPEPRNVFKGASAALRDGKADKEDLTAVFVALCRAAKIPARMVWALDYGYAEFFLVDGEGRGAWYPCVVHEPQPLGQVTHPNPILEKGDNFRVPEEKAAQRFVKEFLTGKGGGGAPTVEFRRRRAD